MKKTAVKAVAKLGRKHSGERAQTLAALGQLPVLPNGVLRSNSTLFSSLQLAQAGRREKEGNKLGVPLLPAFLAVKAVLLELRFYALVCTTARHEVCTVEVPVAVQAPDHGVVIWFPTT